MNAVFRPALRYMGGKWRLAPWIIEQFPPHRTYVEPFGGAASVLLRKPRSWREVYNDLDDEVVTLFRVLRDPVMGADLARQISLTPWARSEFDLSYAPTDDPLECARRTVVRAFMGHGSTAIALRRRTGFRSKCDRNGTHPSTDWTAMPPALEAISERLRGVVIERRPALEVMASLDGPGNLIYADPPYVHAGRSRKRCHGALEHAYKHEMDDAAHDALLTFLLGCASMVVLSGYPTELYDRRLRDWTRLEVQAYADGARPRREVLWINPAASAARGRLFP
jgi:DNA adenine methylase